MKPGDRIRTVRNAEFPCPFCKLRVIYGRLKNDDDRAIVSHPFPMCPKFVDNDGSEFMRLCLDEMEKRIN